jgi:hypothetical protein
MRAVVRDKNGKAIVYFEIMMPYTKNLAKKLGIPFEEYLIELAKIKVEEKRKRKKKKNGNTRKQSKKAS